MKPALSAVCLVVALAGCYRNVPTEPVAVATGTEVVVDLSSSGTTRLTPTLGNFATRVQGTVTAADGGHLTIGLSSVTRRGELQPTQYHGETISLDGSDIEQVFTRTVARRRTTTAFIALGAVGVGLVYALAKAVGILESSGTGNPTPPVP